MSVTCSGKSDLVSAQGQHVASDDVNPPGSQKYSECRAQLIASAAFETALDSRPRAAGTHEDHWACMVSLGC